MKTFLLCFLLVVSASAFAQIPAPDIQWQKSYGGSSSELISSIIPTNDGGYAMAGYSSSTNGDVSGNHGGDDCWVVKVNATGAIQWQKSLGGSQTDRANAIQQTTDGGFIIVGYSLSNNGDVTGHHGSVNYSDLWVVKLTSAGDIQWQESLGGSNYDLGTAVQVTSDGGYIIAGYSYSADGDVTGHHGSTSTPDAWIIKLNSTGAIQWQRSYGGSGADLAYAVQLTADGGYIVAASSISTDGDVTGNHGGFDFWVLKLTSTGAIQWQKSYGGSNSETANGIQVTADGGYIVAGYSGSDNGDVTNNHGNADFWVVKLNNLGSLQWQKSLGGSSGDYANAVQVTPDHGCIVAGYSYSNNGDAAGTHGGVDWLAVKLNATGDKVWQKSVGSSGDEVCNSMSSVPSGGYILAGYNLSTNGGEPDNHGGNDGWVVKLEADSTTHSQTITFNPLPVKKPTDADFTLTATASSGLPVSYTSSDTTVATIINGNTVHIKAIGSTNITASQAGDSIYLAAIPVTQVFNVTDKTQQTITFSALPAKTMTDADFTLAATASSGLSVTYTSSDTTVATIINGNKVHLKAAGTTNITASQAGNATYAPATQVARQLTINKANQSISFPTLYRPASSGDFALNVNTSAGLPITYTIDDTTVATIINGNIVHPKRPSSIKITGTQSGNDIYNPVTASSLGFLSGKTQTISFPIPEGGFYNYQLCNRQAKLTASAASGLPITYTSSDTTVVSIGRDTMYFKKAGIVYVTAHQDGNLYYYSTNPVERKVVVTGTDTTNVIPSISIYYTPILQTICEGNKQLLTFKASIKNGGTTPAYQWKKNNKNVGTNSVTYVDSFYKAGTDSIWCILTASAKCVVNNTAKSNTLGITVHTLPTDTLTVKVISFVPNACLNRAVTFQASIKHGGPAPFYQWKKNGVNVGKDSSFYVDSVLLNTDTVWCVVTGSRYCAAISQVISNKVVQGVVYIKPGTPGTIRGLSNVTAGQQRVGYGVDRVNDVTYEWAVPAGATIIAGQGTNQVVVNWGSTGGNITVRAKNTCGFTDKSVLAVTVAPALGIVNNSADEANSLKAGTHVQLYPNPAAYTAYVDFTAPEAGKYFIQVTDAQGRLLQTKETNAVKGANKLTVDVSRYAQGVYFIRLAGSNRQQSLRLLIQR